MIPLTAREALSDEVERVTATMRPMDVEAWGQRAGIYAVFDEEEGTFLGLMVAGACAQFSQRIFADLLPESEPQPVPAEAPIEEVANQMVTAAVEALPVLDEQGAFLGVVTRPSLLEALLRRERELVAEAGRLRERLEAEQQRLATRSKRFEELLRTTEERLKHLVSSTPAVIYTSEPSPPYGATFISENVKQQLGYDPREFVEDPKFWADHIHPEDAPGIFTKLSQLFKHDHHVHEYRFMQRDGSYRWMRDELKLVRDELGQPVEIVGYWIDITDRKQAEEALRESEKKYRMVVQNINEIIYAVRMENDPLGGTVELVGDQVENIIGYRPDEFLQDPGLWFRLIHPDDVPAVVEATEKLFTSKEPATRVYRVRHETTGVYRWMEDRVMPRLDDAGNVIGIFGVARDITARKQAEEALREMNVALENAMPGISRLDAEGRYVNINEVYARMLGYEPSEMIGLDWKPMLYLDDRKNAIAAHERMLSEGKAEFEARAVRKDGSVFHKQVLMVKIVHKDGKFIGHHCFMRDITERKQAEEALLARTFQIEAVRAVTVEITRELDLASLLALIHRRAAELVGGVSGVVYLWDEAAQLLVPRAWHGMGEWFERMRLRLGEGIAGMVAGRREGMIVNDYVRWPHAVPLTLEHSRITAILAEPLLYRDRLLGVITVNREGIGQGFTQQDRETLALFAAQASVAIENARLYEEAKRRQNAAEALAEVGRLVSQSLDPEEVAQRIVDNVRRLLDVHAATLFRLEPESGDLVTIAISTDVQPALVKNEVLPQDSATVGLALRERKPVTTSDFLIDPRITLTPELRARLEQLPYRAVLAVPLVVQERVIGALSVGIPAGRVFGQEETRLVEAFADQAAIALENAQMFKQVQVGRERLQNLSRRLVETQEAERRSIARELHDEIGQALTAVKINLQAEQRLPGASAPASSLEESISIVDRVLQQVRDLSLDLRPSLLDDLGLVAALRWFVDRQAQRAGIIAQFVADPPQMHLSADIETMCFRLVQEAVTNVVRHARAQLVQVEVRQLRAKLELIIRDDGVGFDVQAAQTRGATGGSLGLLGMRERVLLAGGQIEIESAPTRGTEIRARLPLPPPPGQRVERRRSRRESQ